MVKSKQTITVNFNKIKVLIIRRPGLRNLQEPTVTDNIERSNTFKLLGVLLSSSLPMGFHVKYIISIGYQHLFLIGQ